MVRTCALLSSTAIAHAVPKKPVAVLLSPVLSRNARHHWGLIDRLRFRLEVLCSRIG
jgi:hypothetical protein